VSYEEWTYYGRFRDQTVLRVEKPETGYTERKTPTILRVLADDHVGWGYNGTGTSQAAAHILADALGLGDPDLAGIGFLGEEWNETLRTLAEDFCDEVLMQLPDEWRLSRIAVLRWALGWYTQLGISPTPVILRRLPRPGTVREWRLDLPPRP